MTALGSYLARRKVTFAEFARRLGVEDTTVMRWARGDRCPSGAFVAQIEKATGGSVTAASWGAASRRDRSGRARRAAR